MNITLFLLKETMLFKAMEARRQGTRKLVTVTNKYKPCGFCTERDSGNWKRLDEFQILGTEMSIPPSGTEGRK
jgi:hypothetical protein